MTSRPREFSLCGERGATLVFFALFIVLLTGAAALAIDLGMLYVARSEAQRSADAAALAGAHVFTGSCTLTATCESAGSQSLAAQSAVAAANANHVAGAPGTVDCNLSAGYSSGTCSGIQFTDPTGTGMEPQITVKVQRTGISLIFAKMFGMRTASVSAVATAEAYMGGGIESYVTPFLIPNCDPNTANYNGSNGNPWCYNPATGVSGTLAPFINTDGTVVSPNLYDPTGSNAGALGEPWTLHYAYQGFTTNASGSVSPSQWSMVSFPNANGTYNNSNSNLVSELESGLPPGTAIGCGTYLQTVTGNRPVPIDNAVNQRIGATADGPTNAGQDYLTDSPNAPNASQPYPTQWWGGGTTGTYGGTGTDTGAGFFSVTEGSNSSSPGDPFPSALGSSNSIVLAPLFNANTLDPGNQTVKVVGFAVLFLDYSAVDTGQETVQANVINLIPCGGAGLSNNSNGVVADASPIPIRLIRHPN